MSSRDTYSEYEKRRIMAILGEGKDLMEIVSAKIYTTGKDGTNWLYSDLEGFLCYVIDYTEKNQFFVLYDYTTYEKLLQFELYEDFNKYYTELTKLFHCFETNNGFIGIKFIEETEAKNYFNRLTKSDSKALTLLFKKSNVARRREKLKKGRENILDLKERFCKDEALNNIQSELIGEGVEILKPGYYEIFNNVSYDKEKKIFKVDKLSSDLKNLFKLAGVRKSHFKNESLALNIFKFFTICYDQLQNMKRLRTQNLLKIDSSKILIKQEHNEEIKKFLQINNFKIENSYDLIYNMNKRNTAILPNIPNIPNVPNFPKFPIKQNIPAVPKIPTPPIMKSQSMLIINSKINPENKQLDENIFTDDLSKDLSQIKLRPVNLNTSSSTACNVSDDTPKESLTSNPVTGSFLDEIRKGVQLKKINYEKNEEEKRPVKINKQDTNYLQNALQQAIKQRREDLTKNDIEESGSDSEWSD